MNNGLDVFKAKLIAKYNEALAENNQPAVSTILELENVFKDDLGHPVSLPGPEDEPIVLFDHYIRNLLELWYTEVNDRDIIETTLDNIPHVVKLMGEIKERNNDPF